MLTLLLRLVVVLFPVSEAALAVFKRANRRTAEVEDRGSLRALWLAILGGFAVAVAGQWARWARLRPSSWHQALALCFLSSGLALRWASILTLGRFFTVDVAIHARHRIVDSGPYRVIRHPSYTGLLLAFVGLGLVFSNWLSLAALVLPVGLAVLNRIRKEEEALGRAFGASYADYCARTRRLVPWLY